MIIGVIRFGLHFPGAGSLKDKRRILVSLKDRLKNKFNVSVAELEDNELWQKSVIGVAIIANDKTYANSVLSKVTIKNKKNGKELTYQIVAESEADLKAKKISVNSPIGQGLLGKAKGETAVVTTPAGNIEFEIMNISL